MKNILYLISGFILLTSCQSATHDKPNASKNKFADAQIRAIYDLADRRQTDSLLMLLPQLSENYQLEIATVLASVQDSSALPTLLNLLESPQASLRRASAYAIGQLGITSVQKKLIQLIDNEKDTSVKIVLMEALGKSADSLGTNYLARQNYDTEPEKYGQILGLYRAVLRGFSHPEAVQKAIYFLEIAQDSERLHLKASEYLARNRYADYTKIIVYQEPVYEMIVRFIRTSYNPFVRMNLVQACRNYDGKLPKTYTDSLALTLKFDKNEVVRIACAQTLSKGQNVSSYLLEALSDDSPNVRVAIAQTLVRLDEEVDFNKALQQPKLRFRERAILQGGALRQNPEYASKIIQEYEKSSNLYEKGLLLKALAQNLTKFEFIKAELFNFKSAILATYAMESLLEMRQHPDFEKHPENLTQFDSIIRFAVKNGDASLGYLVGNELQIPERNYAQRFKNLDFLSQAINQLKLPKEQETYIALQQAYEFLSTGKTLSVPAPKFNHPIDWEKVQQIPVNQQVRVSTSKGEMIWNLYVEAAPATVNSFLELIDNQFYNHKTFHRIVPNFVAQGGCPRGDGFGSTDYSIRSEFAPLNYHEGTIGMASAGKDTEGCQWFITHIPTPHLDGKYTIFAQIQDGFEVVHQLEMGDKIEKIERL